MERLLLYAAALLLMPAAARAQGFKLDNPIQGVSDIGGLIDLVANNLFTIAIPIAVLMYIYAGVLYMTAGANPPNVQKAKNVMLYTSIGLAIILIGSGFVDLIRSILNLG